MKQCIGGNGLDTTAAAAAYLANGHQFQFADLYMIGDAQDPNAVFLTNWESSLLYSQWGTFINSVVSRNTVTMKLGLEVQQLEVSWSPKLTAFGFTLATSNFYQKASGGFYRNWPVRVWRTIMPTPGDANTFGAYELFGGRVGQVEVSRNMIKITVNSFLDVLQEQVPPNVIENTSVLANYSGATPVYADSETEIATFTVVGPTSSTNILATCNGPSAGKIYDGNKLQYGYIYFEKGSALAGYFSMIAQNDDFNAGSGVHYNQFFVYAAFPWDPSPGDQFYVSSQAPVDASQGTIGMNSFPFPFVPSPESAV